MPKDDDFEHIFTRTRVAHVLEVLDDACTTFRSEHIFSIRAELRSRFFLRRYTWTGSDDDSEPELETDYDMWGHPKHKLHGPVIREGIWRLALVDLGRTLEIEEEDTLHFHHRLRDLKNQFQPFLGQQPRVGTKNIRLTVILPNSLARDVVFVERTLDSERVINSEELKGEPTSSGKQQFEKEINDPVEKNRGYRICWKRRS